jgi:Tfp pilus assembly protein PilV
VDSAFSPKLKQGEKQSLPLKDFTTTDQDAMCFSSTHHVESPLGDLGTLLFPQDDAAESVFPQMDTVESMDEILDEPVQFDALAAFPSVDVSDFALERETSADALVLPTPAEDVMCLPFPSLVDPGLDLFELPLVGDASIDVTSETCSSVVPDISTGTTKRSVSGASTSSNVSSAAAPKGYKANGQPRKRRPKVAASEAVKQTEKYQRRRKRNTELARQNRAMKRAERDAQRKKQCQVEAANVDLKKLVSDLREQLSGLKKEVEAHVSSKYPDGNVPPTVQMAVDKMLGRM